LQEIASKNILPLSCKKGVSYPKEHIKIKYKEGSDCPKEQIRELVRTVGSYRGIGTCRF